MPVTYVYQKPVPENWYHNLVYQLQDLWYQKPTWQTITYGIYFVAYTTREFHYGFMEVIIWVLLEYIHRCKNATVHDEAVEDNNIYSIYLDARNVYTLHNNNLSCFDFGVTFLLC